jgi:hypothetical protein
METLRSSETSVLTRATRRNISEDAIPHSHRRENLISYIENTMFQKLALFPFSGAGRKTTTLLGPLERANLNHWTQQSRSFPPFV